MKLNNRKISKSDADDLVEWALRGANLWNEVRIVWTIRASACPAASSSVCASHAPWPCIRRCCSWTNRAPPSIRSPPLAVEDLINELKNEYTIVIVTHNMQQAARIADYTAFFNLKAVGQPGHLEYFTDTTTMFNNPQNEEAERYVSGRFG